MKHPTTQALYAYWNSLRGERMAPRRLEIEPGRMGDILSSTFILERVSEQRFTYRLAGSRIGELFAAEFRGVDFLEAWQERDRTALRTRLNTIAVQGGVVLVTVEARNALDQAVLMEMMILPLVHQSPIADRFLGAMAPIQTPSWLGSQPLTSLQLLTDQIVWPDGQPHPPVNAPDPQSPFLPRIRTARIVRQDRRQFRIYDGGRQDTPQSET